VLIFDLVTLIIASITMLAACYSDVKSRSVNSYLFVPLIVVGSISSALQGAGYVPILAILGLYIFSFFSRHPFAYISGGVGVFAAATFFSLGDLYSEGYLLFVMIPYLIAFRERLFGVGDVKAIIALSLAFMAFPANLKIFSLAPAYLSLPFSFVLLFNSSFVSVAFIPYLMAINYLGGSRLGFRSLLGVEYSEGKEIRNPEKYAVVESQDRKFLVYRVPYMIPIAVGMIIALATGI
jgi:hypothetical protein